MEDEVCGACGNKDWFSNVDIGKRLGDYHRQETFDVNVGSSYYVSGEIVVCMNCGTLKIKGINTCEE